MHAASMSTNALLSTSRLFIAKAQSELSDRLTEATTQRHADVGLALGYTAGQSVSGRAEMLLLDALQRSNTGVSAQLELSQTALSDVATVTSDTLSAALAVPGGTVAAAALAIEARGGLDQLAARMNATDGNGYIFAGIQSATRPFADYDGGPEASVIATFAGFFGVAPGAPGTELIAPADMTAFLDTVFADLFADPSWGTTWSRASDTDRTTLIAPDERVRASTNANIDAVRDSARGLAMLASLGLATLNEGARAAVLSAAQETLGAAGRDLAAAQAELGFVQNAIARANDRLTDARSLLQRTVAEREAVDPVAAKVRIDLLSAQLEASYALTAQISRLSILNYA